MKLKRDKDKEMANTYNNMIGILNQMYVNKFIEKDLDIIQFGKRRERFDKLDSSISSVTSVNNTSFSILNIKENNHRSSNSINRFKMPNTLNTQSPTKRKNQKKSVFSIKFKEDESVLSKEITFSKIQENSNFKTIKSDVSLRKGHSPMITRCFILEKKVNNF